MLVQSCTKTWISAFTAHFRLISAFYLFSLKKISYNSVSHDFHLDFVSKTFHQKMFPATRGDFHNISQFTIKAKETQR